MYCVVWYGIFILIIRLNLIRLLNILSTQPSSLTSKTQFIEKDHRSNPDNFEEETRTKYVSTRRKRVRFFMILRAGLVKLNNKWRLARTVCAEGWNRATLMSGGSHRLWNQLLHATLFRSTSLFRWSTDAARLSARLASNSAPSLSPVPGPKGQRVLSPSSTCQRERRRFIPYRKKLPGRMESRRFDSTKGQTSAG